MSGIKVEIEKETGTDKNNGEDQQDDAVSEDVRSTEALDPNVNVPDAEVEASKESQNSSEPTESEPEKVEMSKLKLDVPDIHEQQPKPSSFAERSATRPVSAFTAFRPANRILQRCASPSLSLGSRAQPDSGSNRPVSVCCGNGGTVRSHDTDSEKHFHSIMTREEHEAYLDLKGVAPTVRKALLDMKEAGFASEIGTLPCPMIQNYIDLPLYHNPVAEINPTIRFRTPDEHVSAEIHHHRVPACMGKWERLWGGYMPCGYTYAGPRREIIFKCKEDPVRAAIVTCGGLCPGLNSVICELVKCLNDSYGCSDVYGIQYGYRGFYSFPYLQLTPQAVDDIHKIGGTILGSSRGGFDLEKIVNSLVENGINCLFVIGGDGTQRGTLELSQEILKRKLKIAVVGIPKTIDNDVGLLDRTFGFETAVEEASNALERAYVEASSAWNGIAIVKLMGRSSGFVAAQASAASGYTDICLIPEISYELDGQHGLLSHIQSVLERKGKCVIALAEAAGADKLPPTNQKDLSGNPKLPDVGVWLKKQVELYFKSIRFPAKVFYIDPSYLIRSVPPNNSDRLYCTMLSHMAVHGAMAGFTGIIVGLVHNSYVYLPIAAVVAEPRTVKIDSNIWQRCLETTGQPAFY